MQHYRRAGCWVCWKRKIKCDGIRPNPCQNCTRRGVNCQYENRLVGKESDEIAIPSQHTTEAGIPRDRSRRACSNCASQKVKCSGDLACCQRCATSGLPCQYLPSKRRQRTANSQTQSTRALQRRTRDQSTLNDSGSEGLSARAEPRAHAAGSSIDATNLQSRSESPMTNRIGDEILLRKDFVQRHVSAYFEYIYPITTHGFIHQGSFLQDLHENRSSAPLVKAIVVATARFVSTASESISQAAKWANENDCYIMANLETLSILNLQLVLLSIFHYKINRNFGKVWMLLGLAARMAYALQINVDSKIGSFTEIECRKRIMWNIHVQDRLLAGSVGEFTIASGFLTNLTLPCDEQPFLSENPVKTETLDGLTRNAHIPNIGGFAYMIRVVNIWYDVHQFMKRVSGNMGIETIKQKVSELHSQLSQLEKQLPSCLKFTTRNLYLLANTPQRINFIMLQSWWYECHCNLYRFSLRGFRESVPFTSQDDSFRQQCQQQVFQFAVAQSNLWRLIASIEDIFVSDPLIGVLVYSNTKILLACQRTGLYESDTDSNPGQTCSISTLLASNASFLGKLAQKLPMVAIIQQEISTLIGTKCLHASEAAIYGALPLRRQLSRQHLLDETRRQEESHDPDNNAYNRPKVVQTSNEDPTPDTMMDDLPSLNPERSLGSDGADPASAEKSRGQTCASIKRSEVDLDVVGAQRVNRPGIEQQQLVWDAEFQPSASEFHEYTMTDTPFWGFNQPDVFDGVASYFAPFPTNNQDDLNAGAYFMGDEGQMLEFNMMS